MCYGNILSQSMVKVRKRRYCFGCCQYFEPGVRMFRVAAKDGGEITNSYTCEPCHEYIKEHGKEMDPGDGCLMDGCVTEDKRERAAHEKWVREHSATP